MSSARRPWRVVGVWGVGVVVGVVAVGGWLGGALSSEGRPTNSPQSERAKEALSAAFPPTVGSAVTDIVVVRSRRYLVGAPEFRALLGGLVSRVGGAGGVESVHSY